MQERQSLQGFESKVGLSKMGHQEKKILEVLDIEKYAFGK